VRRPKGLGSSVIRSCGVVAVVLALAASGCSRPSTPDNREPRPARASAAAPPSSRPSYQNTGDDSELVHALPVKVGATAASKRVVYSQAVTLREGQVLLAVAEFQVTNNLDLNVFVGSTVLLTTSPEAINGREITAANGQNVTPAMHHGQQSKNGTYQATAADAGVRYVNVVAWAAASNALPGNQISVDPGYGRLSVLTW
jgi:hypothetical protein